MENATAKIAGCAINKGVSSDLPGMWAGAENAFPSLIYQRNFGKRPALNRSKLMEQIMFWKTHEVMTMSALDFEQAKHDLLVLRNAHGAETEIGHICSNIVTQMDAYRNEPDEAARGRLAVAIAQQTVALAKAISAKAQ